jgi:hypothetical protein
MIEVKLDETKLTITIPRRPPQPSKSGKTVVLGTTRGVKTGAATYKGQPVCVVASAFVYPKQKLTLRKRGLDGRTTGAAAAKEKPTRGSVREGGGHEAEN